LGERGPGHPALDLAIGETRLDGDRQAGVVSGMPNPVTGSKRQHRGQRRAREAEDIEADCRGTTTDASSDGSVAGG
jgi:hypothetical protein